MVKHKHTATSDAVYTQLKEQILHLELPPGSAISEIDTAEKYSVSRTPVRDAFKRLEREGLLEIQPHVGTFISLIDLNTVSDVLYMRAILEYSILSDLSHMYDKALELRIQLLLQEQKELTESDLPICQIGRAFLASDNEFHDVLFTAAGKQNIGKFLRQFNYQYERFRTYINFNNKENLQTLYNEHIQIWNCIKTQNLTALKECLNHHLYDGFSASTDIISKHPEFFKKMT